MSMTCTRCNGTGFLNVGQLPDGMADREDHATILLGWISENKDHDVTVCDCCGDGEEYWFGVPGEHYNNEDPAGHNGPYAYNGGLCECH